MKNKSIKIAEHYDTNLDSENNKISEEFVYQMIRYTDEHILEKMRKFENINQKKLLRESSKSIAYMNLFI